MLQPAAITALLSQLIHDDKTGDAASIRPHTALLTLLDSSELYAVATRLADLPPSKSAVASILASTAAAAGTPPPVHHGNGRPLPLTSDERAACLSAIAVISWRQATEGANPRKVQSEAENNVVMPGASVSVAKHAVTGMTSASGKKATSKELVPLLLEGDLGRILVMPVVPSAPTLSASRSELAAMDDSHDDAPSFADHRKPFMLLTLNAASDSPLPTLPKSPSTPNNTTTSPALASSTATLSAANPAARSRLRSGGTTPTSTRSDHTPTPSRSPVSDHFPTTPGGPHSSVPLPGSEAEAAPAQSASAEQEAWEAKLWTALYAQAKALARVLAPSLTKCGVGQHHIEEHAAEMGRQSALVSDDEADA